MKTQISLAGFSLADNCQRISVGVSRCDANQRQSFATLRKRDATGLAGWLAMRKHNTYLGLVIAALLQLGTNLALQAQIVEKVADLNIAGGGLGAPIDRFTQVGTNLWFTTEKGGTFDPAGTISRYDLVTREVTVVASLQNSTGTSPESSLFVVGDEGYFTTKSGGSGNAGTIAKINLTNGTITTLYNFPQNSAATRNAGTQTGATSRSGFVRIGDELWATTSLGGTSNRGTIFKYNLTNGVTSQVTYLDGPQRGGQAFDGFTPAGSNAWYYTTFSGGSTFASTNGQYSITLPDQSVIWITNSLSLGAGVLAKLSFDGGGQPVVTRLVDLTNGYTQFPGSAPTLVGTNSLYFGTTGPNNAPGALVRYDIDSGLATNLFIFPTNTATAIGSRPGYSGLTEFRGDLYFINRLGGISNAGVVAKFNIASNTVTKIADLDGAALGDASGFFGAGTLVEENGRSYIYYPLTSGGVNNNGAIIRIDLAAFRVKIAPESGNQIRLFWDGGYPPFTVQQRTNLLDDVWVDVVQDLTNRSVVLPLTNTAAYYQVIGQP